MEGELATAVDSIIKARWNLRAGEVIPETDDITLGNSCVTLEATVLYADLADSTELAIFDGEIAAEVYKAYLVGTTAASGGSAPDLTSQGLRPWLVSVLHNFRSTIRSTNYDVLYDLHVLRQPPRTCKSL